MIALRRSKRPKYQLHQTYVRKIVRIEGADKDRDGITNEKEEGNDNFRLPPFVVGRLVEFHTDEDITKTYTIKWERKKFEEGKTCINETSLPSELTSLIKSTCDMNSIERWTESRVAIGILLHQKMGLKVAKKFDAGIFIGQVVDIYADDGNFFNVIVFDDGDSEDFNENELQKGVEFYCKLQKQRKRKLSFTTKATSNSTKAIKRSQLISSKAMEKPNNGRNITSSFEALYDKATPIHTLILGTHPAKKSLRERRYFSNSCNAFWWIAGDCLGFRRDLGEKTDGGFMKLCADLRHGESRVIPYEQQVNILCQHGFALWDIVASCRRIGSLDSAIKSDNPNDIRAFVKQHPTIKIIVFANGKSSLDVFNRHFKEWWSTGEIILHKSSCTTIFKSSSNKDEVIKSDKPNVIKCICAISVSPAAATVTYKEKRDFWGKFIYSPGLRYHEEHVRKRIVTPVSHHEQQQKHHGDTNHHACSLTKGAATAIITPQVSDSSNYVAKNTKTAATLVPTPSMRSMPSDELICTQNTSQQIVVSVNLHEHNKTSKGPGVN